MNLVYPTAELLRQEDGRDGIYKQIERAARTCYKSEGNKGKEFVDKLIENKHTAMLEHGTVYLTLMLGSPVHDPNYVVNFHIKQSIISSPYTKYKSVDYDVAREAPDKIREYINNYGPTRVYYITTNLRVLYENFEDRDREHILDLFLDNPSLHPKRYSVKVTCDRGVSHEIVRHRKFSFAQESTRYCNYSKEKFGREITYIIPTWITNFEDYQERFGIPCEGAIIRPPVDDLYLMSIYTFFYSLYYSEENYFRLLDLGKNPQEARQVLPNALKTEIVITGFEEDWDYFLDVRTTNKYGVPHPDMKNVALMIKSVLDLERMIN